MSLQTFDPAAYKAGQRRDWTEAAGGWGSGGVALRRWRGRLGIA